MADELAPFLKGGDSQRGQSRKDHLAGDVNRDDFERHSIILTQVNIDI